MTGSSVISVAAAGVIEGKLRNVGGANNELLCAIDELEDFGRLLRQTKLDGD